MTWHPTKQSPCRSVGPAYGYPTADKVVLPNSGYPPDAINLDKCPVTIMDTMHQAEFDTWSYRNYHKEICS